MGQGAGRGGRGPVEDGARVQWVFLGCPGVGKGAYAGRLLRLLGVPRIATGDPVRHELASQGPLSKQPHDALRRLRSAIVLFSVADETFRCIQSPLFQALYSGRSFPSHFSLPGQPQKHPISPPTTLPEHLPQSARAPHFAGTPICRAGFPFEVKCGARHQTDSFQRRSANPKGSWLGGKGH